MTVLFLSLLFTSCILIFLGKAVADMTSNKTLWEKSIISKLGNKESFWGSKEFTYKRKYRKNPFLKYLFSTILVFTTDVWHLANTVRRIGIYSSIFWGISYGAVATVTFKSLLLIMTLFILLNIIGFHLTYTYILRK